MKLWTPHIPPLDPEFLPAFSWNQAFKDQVSSNKKARSVEIALIKSDDDISIFRTRILPKEPLYHSLNIRFTERLLKFLLWQRGAWKVIIKGAPECVPILKAIFSDVGERKFDSELLGEKVFGKSIEIVADEQTEQSFPEEREPESSFGNHFKGCRVGFDLGGSDRKCAALIDGEVIFSEEVAWNPYFQNDPSYHLDGILNSIKTASSKLPKVDAIGGSAAGIYIENEVKVASLFRGIDSSDFKTKIKSIFKDIAKKLGNPPMVVVNDGDVTALAGSKLYGKNGLLGISMGTSQAVGYVNTSGNLNNWLNELAFAPVDYRENAPVDEWSQDLGCGVQYFSQQAVARLFPKTKLSPQQIDTAPELLKLVQSFTKKGDSRVLPIYQSIGVYLAYALAHYSDFYELSQVLLLGRVLSGEGGQILLDTCKKALVDIHPNLASKVSIDTPNETFIRHGQAIAAAGLVPHQ